MRSISRLILAVGIVFFVGGVAGGVLGSYLHATDTCQSGYGLYITPLSENRTADPTFEYTKYDTLSETEQRMFQEILTAEEPPVYQNTTVLEDLSKRVVEYQGERYETSEVSVQDCSSGWNTLANWGGFSAALGGVVIIIASLWHILETTSD